MFLSLKGWVFSADYHRDTLWRSIKATISIVLVFSVVFISYSAVSSTHYQWSCPHCDQYPDQFPVAIPGPTASPEPTNTSHIVFGIGASSHTWHQRRGYSELWWIRGEMKGHVWLDDEPKRGSWPDTCPPYRVSADASRYGARASASRIARIVAESFALGMENVRWFVMGDDDTVFFVENLVAVLGKYDHDQMWYIGAPSESVEQNLKHSYGMAFGGGGFAISYPAAAELAKVIDGCLDRYIHFYGSDERIQACLSELGVPLTREPGFHQVDLRGDAYGMLAAHPIAPLVSLHHLDDVHTVTPSQSTQMDAIRTLMDASRHDPPRTLQQTFCYNREQGHNWSVSVSWGYTVQLYHWVIPPHDLEVPLQTFHTWRSSQNGPFVFNTRPFTVSNNCEPMLFFLDRVSEKRKAQEVTVTEYTKHETSIDKGCDRAGFTSASQVQSIRVVAPKMDPYEWQKAPRRHCCEARTKVSNEKIIDVWIRHCYPGEITSPL
ncbi:putative O-fucosylpeptide 3-beta-N-acetylglucosaminyltransferase [Dioscorea sansibarensis]